jgi:hypothetical protein
MGEVRRKRCGWVCRIGRRHDGWSESTNEDWSVRWNNREQFVLNLDGTSAREAAQQIEAMLKTVAPNGPVSVAHFATPHFEKGSIVLYVQK